MDSLFYKYLPLNKPEQVDQLSSLLIDGSMYISKPTNFNDPNEFRFQYRPPKDKEIIKIQYFLDNPSSSIDDFERWFSSESWDSVHLYYEPLWQRELLNSHGVLCLSLTCNNPTMWAHYGDNHKGICIGFNKKIIDHIPHIAYGNVIYTDALPIVQYFGEPVDSLVKSVFLHKHIDWSYEKEFRIISNAGGVIIKIPLYSIDSIIIGHNMDRGTMDKVVSIVESRSVSIKMLNATLSYVSYYLDINSL